MSGGACCLTLKQWDYIQIGPSIFIGLRETKGFNQAGITIIAPKDVSIQRYVIVKE